LISQNSQISVRSECFLENKILNPGNDKLQGSKQDNYTFIPKFNRHRNYIAIILVLHINAANIFLEYLNISYYVVDGNRYSSAMSSNGLAEI
jgi:hypothetical protein